MYRSSYAEVLADSQTEARALERNALERAVMLLERAQTAAPQSPETHKAIEFVTQLWQVFIKDLSRPDNDLPQTLRGQLISIGLGIMLEASRITQGVSRDFKTLAEICGIVRDGLA